MKVILYMAISVNGFIARENGDEDFLSHENWKKLCSLTREFGNIIWGRKTYEAVKNWDNGEHLRGLRGQKIIISQNNNLKLPHGYSTASSPREALKKIQKSFAFRRFYG